MVGSGDLDILLVMDTPERVTLRSPVVAELEKSELHLLKKVRGVRCSKFAKQGKIVSGSVVIASVVSNTIQRVLQSPVVLTKKAKTAKAREKVEKWFSLVDVTFRSVSDT